MVIQYRKYKNYNHYLTHQSVKLDKIILKKNKRSQKVRPECFRKQVRKFKRRLENVVKYINEDDKILCMGDRTGAEVVSFKELGFQDTIGIDINPGKNNQYVIKGNIMYDILEKEIGPLVGIYRKRWDASGKNEIQLSYPLHLNFELMFGCNFKCDFCLYSIPIKKWSYVVEPRKKISFEKYCEIIDEGVDNGLCSIELNGINEPLLQKDIVKYIQYAKNKGILIISLHTNGFLLTPDFSEQLIRSGLTIIIFSVDACTKETYSKMRYKNFDILVNNVEIFFNIRNKLNYKLPLVRISTNENKVNKCDIDNFVNFWQKWGDIITISPFCNPFIDDKKYKEIENKYRLDDHVVLVCDDPFHRLLIQNNGNVCPCCAFFAGNLVVGNIYEDSIYNIWNNDKMRDLRSKVNGPLTMQPTICQVCKLSKSSHSHNRLELKNI